jgi:multidrug transporter EmrE-like cation transporter
MIMVAGISIRTILLVLFVCVTQTAGGTFLVKSNAFRELGWTAAAAAIYVPSFYALALLFRDAPFSVVSPILAGLCPLLAILVGVVLLGEPASWQRISLLVAACGMVGLAARL